MKSKDLLLSSLHITEDEYHYKGQFILSCGTDSINVDVTEFQTDPKVSEIKKIFDLEEPLEEIRSTIMTRIIEKSTLSSRNVEGENYNRGM